jgi:hypothetical protein
MKKIAIITFHASYNCGSMLQAYALQKKVDVISCSKSKIIDFSNNAQRRMYRFFFRLNHIKLIILDFLAIPCYFLWTKQRNDYKSFFNNYFDLSPDSYSKNSQLKVLDGLYDYFITGSDQVWNINCPDADDAYFLNFVHSGKKIAYAVSLGAYDISKASDSDKYRKYLSDFTYISVREHNAVRQIACLTGKKIEMALDPTFFLSKEDWDLLIPEKRAFDGDYIFYYAFAYPVEVNRVVKEIARKTNLPVVVLDVKSWIVRMWFLNFKTPKYFGPLAFLNLIKHAQLVLTTSFHGTVFSTIFEKSFWFIESSMHHPNDDRAGSLLRQLGLQHRLASEEEIYNNGIFEKINFHDVKENINKLKEESVVYLKNAVL